MIEKSAEEDFIELVAENWKVGGFDELSSEIFGILLIEQSGIGLDELAKRTGYSLSAVSTAMKHAERMRMVKKSKKANSRKVYFYVENDMVSILLQILRREYENIVLPSKTKLPEIIEQYKLEESKSNNLEEKLKIVDNYYKMILVFEQILKQSFEKLEQYVTNNKKEGKKGGDMEK